MKVCLGGTFHPFHKDHKMLLRKAFQTAGPSSTVFIGFTPADIIQKQGKLASFNKRRKDIIELVQP